MVRQLNLKLLADLAGGGTSVPRNCILSSKFNGRNADFFSVSSLTLTLEADATDPFVYDIDGTEYELTSDATLAATDDANNFVYIDAAGVMGRSAKPCRYSWDAPAGPAANDFWFDLGKNRMKKYDGAVWVVTPVVFIGYVRADGGAINARYVCEPCGMTPEARFSAMGDGQDGLYELTSGTTTFDGTKRCTAIIVRGTAVLRHSLDARTAQVLMSQGIIAVLDTASIDNSGRGVSGGNGATGAGSGGISRGMGGGGGGGGGGSSAAGGAGSAQKQAEAPGSTAGAVAAVGIGANGNNATAVGIVPSVGWPGSILGGFGNSGGGGGGDGTNPGGNGGPAGGAHHLYAAAVGIGASASIKVDGGNGVAGAGSGRGGGGGGGGGTSEIYSRNFVNSGTHSAAAGTGGAAGGGTSGTGGNGAVGSTVWVQI